MACTKEGKSALEAKMWLANVKEVEYQITMVLVPRH